MGKGIRTRFRGRRSLEPSTGTIQYTGSPGEQARLVRVSRSPLARIDEPARAGAAREPTTKHIEKGLK